MRRVHQCMDFENVPDFHREDVISPPTEGQRDLLISGAIE